MNLVRRIMPCLLVFILCLMAPRPARAFALHVWSPQQLVNASDVLAVVEVLKPEGAPDVPANAKHPKSALSPQVRVRVLRSFAASPQSAIADGEEIIVNRSRQEIAMGETFARGKGWSGPADWNFFGGLAAGQIVILPLKIETDAVQSDTAKRDASEAAVATMWRLAAEGGTGFYVPATRGASAAKAKNGIEFLGIEVAGSLMSEQVDERSRAAGYLNEASRGGLNITNVAPIDVISQRLENEIGSDKARWLDIFTSLYLSTGTPRPAVGDLLSDNKKRKLSWNRSFWNLAANVLKRADGDDLETRLVTAFVASAARSSWAAATALESNYPLHPATLKFFRDGLEEARPEAMERVLYLLDDAEKDRYHPLVPEALQAAKSVLHRPRLEPRGLWAASTIIRRFGSESDVALLINDFKTSQKTDRVRYRALWASNQGRERGWMAIYRIVVLDKAFESGGLRFCDQAVWRLQIEARQEFGWKHNDSLAQHDRAVARARLWLDKSAKASALQTTKKPVASAKKL